MKTIAILVLTPILGLVAAKTAWAQYPSWLSTWERSVVALGVVDSLDVKGKDGQTRKQAIFKVVGTGVTFYIRMDETILPMLITAKHVFFDPENNWAPTHLRLRFSWFEDRSVAEYLGMPINLTINGSPMWIAHGDSLVDLACFPLLDLPEDVGTKSFPVLPYSQFADSNDIYSGNSIWVLGYPGSVGIEFWSRALLRQGIISWSAPIHPERNRILIDADVFPGNSGGPVFTLPTGVNKDGNLKMGGPMKFLGIVSQRRFSPTPIRVGESEVINPSGSKLYSLESIGIGVVEPASRVNELLAQVEQLFKSLKKKK